MVGLLDHHRLRLVEKPAGGGDRLRTGAADLSGNGGDAGRGGDGTEVGLVVADLGAALREVRRTGHPVGQAQSGGEAGDGR
ncbi:hypothetical protein ABZ726_23875 [Streptomyces hundungensis]|uniref:hypothetical protein n=1 Tax=Streptomyces hundungensis TaxID=1077946 RepID=UPI0033FAC0A3